MARATATRGMDRGTYLSDEKLRTETNSEILDVLKESVSEAIKARQNAWDLLNELTSRAPLRGYCNPVTMATEHPGCSAWMHVHRAWLAASVPVLKAHLQATEFAIAQAYQNIRAEDEHGRRSLFWDRIERERQGLYVIDCMPHTEEEDTEVGTRPTEYAHSAPE